MQQFSQITSLTSCAVIQTDSNQGSGVILIRTIFVVQSLVHGSAYLSAQTVLFRVAVTLSTASGRRVTLIVCFAAQTIIMCTRVRPIAPIAFPIAARRSIAVASCVAFEVSLRSSASP